MTPRIPARDLFREGLERLDPTNSGGAVTPVAAPPDQLAVGGDVPTTNRPPTAHHVTAGPGAESALQALSGGHPAGGVEPPDMTPAPPATYQLLTRWRRRRYDRRVANIHRRMSQLGEGWPR